MNTIPYSIHFRNLNMVFLWLKPCKNSPFYVPNRHRKTFKKTKKNVDTFLILCDIRDTHGNNRTKIQEKYEN